MSDAAAEQRDRKRICRGRAIEVLYRFFENGQPIVDLPQIKRLLSAYSEIEIQHALGYLQQRGYIEDRTHRLDARDTRQSESFMITADGTELAEGTKEDGGVVFE